MARWRDVVVYQLDTGLVEVKWFFERFAELHNLIDLGLHGETMNLDTVYSNWRIERGRSVRIEEARGL